MAKKYKGFKGCESCKNCMYICEGDGVCDEMVIPVVVMKDFTPTDDYYTCKGKWFEEN